MHGTTNEDAFASKSRRKGPKKQLKSASTEIVGGATEELLILAAFGKGQIPPGQEDPIELKLQRCLG